MLFLSIPYDENWKIKIDGKTQKQLKILDSMTAIKVEKGKHTIEMKYHTKGFAQGVVISVLTLIFLIINYRRQRKKND